MEGSLWSVVLAAGAGRRLSALTGGTPKQFWRPAGGASLIEGTLARLAPMCPPERTVIVVGDGQREHVRRWPAYRRSGRIVYQPGDRGTAAGVLFGLLPVIAADPEAVVLITPSDHGVTHEEPFREGILEAVAHVQHPGGVVLFGVEPTAPRDDYGWITLRADDAGAGIRPVAAFVEKPPVETASRLFATGAVWNSMVVVARVRDVVDLFREHIPEQTAVFLAALDLPREARPGFLADRYPAMVRADFSRDVLTPARRLFTYTWPASMGWSDLGTPERMERWLRPARKAAADSEVTLGTYATV